MTRTERLGLVVLAIGGALGVIVGGGPVGLIFAAICLVVGFVLFVASEARGTGKGPTGARTPGPGLQKTRILVLVKEIHARPEKSGRFHEIRDPGEPDLEFEVFASCWLVNETDLPLKVIEEPQLTVTTSDGSTRVAEPIKADLKKWRLGSLVKDPWDADIVRAAQEPMAELDTGEPLECGVPRQGWLHFRIRNLSPSEFMTAGMELSITDSQLCTHVGTAKEPRHLPGRVWPAAADSTRFGGDKEAISPA